MAETKYTDNVVIEGSRDLTQLRVEGTAGQTKPLQQWQDDADSVKAQVTHDGRLQIGNDWEDSAPTALIEVHRDDTPGDEPTQGLSVLATLSGAASHVLEWVVHKLQLHGSGGVSSQATALRAELTHNNTGDSSAADLRGGSFEVVNQSGSSATPVGQAVGVRAAVSNESRGRMNNAIGVQIEILNDNPSTNPISNAYGIKVADIEQATQNYALYTGKGAAHLGDVLEVPVFGSTPTDTPPMNYIQLYTKLNGSAPQLYAKDDHGVEYQLIDSRSSGSKVLGVTKKSLFVEETLDTVTLKTDQASFDIDPLPTGYDQIIIRSFARLDRGSNHGNTALYFNDDTTNLHYRRNRVLNGHGQNYADEPEIDLLPATGAHARVWGVNEMIITYHEDTSRYTVVTSHSHGADIDSKGVIAQHQLVWKNTAVVTKIRIEEETGSDFLTGSRFEIIGRKKQDVVVEVKGWQQVEYVQDNVSNPPSVTEITTAFDTPANVGEGYIGIINDNGVDSHVWFCLSTGSDWWYTSMTKAI